MADGTTFLRGDGAWETPAGTVLTVQDDGTQELQVAGATLNFGSGLDVAGELATVATINAHRVPVRRLPTPSSTLR